MRHIQRNVSFLLSSISISYEKRISQRESRRINSSIAQLQHLLSFVQLQQQAPHILPIGYCGHPVVPCCLCHCLCLPVCLPHQQAKWPIKRWQAAAVNCRTRLVLVSQCGGRGRGRGEDAHTAWGMGHGAGVG